MDINALFSLVLNCELAKLTTTLPSCIILNQDTYSFLNSAEKMNKGGAEKFDKHESLSLKNLGQTVHYSVSDHIDVEKSLHEVFYLQ